MQYHLTRSKRKTIAISFDRDGNLCVKAPVWVSKRTIEAFLLEKADWIDATSKRLQKQRQKELLMRRKLENGEKLPYLGQKKILTVVRQERQQCKVRCIQERLIMSLPYDAGYEDKKIQLEKWYRKEAAVILEEKAKYFSQILSVQYKDIRIKDQKSRWGSCSSKGNLNFNFRIIMAPEAVCDYVVIHELCHLTYMNHSEDFWQLVASVCPSYKQYVRWLKENGQTLYF